MPTVHHLPPNPSLDRVRRRARALQRAVRAGDSGAADRVRRQHPDGVPADPAAFHLSAAKLVVAREYGFASWPRLRRYFDLVGEHGWDASAPARAEDPADEFCRLACLTYDADDPARWARARRLLAEQPALVDNHIWAAAAAADLESVRRRLATDPGLARQRGGPYRWTPLCYLAYSRFDPDVPAQPVLAITRLLLDTGADPDEGYLWNGQPYPFTLLTGVFGGGELGPERQPGHPHAAALARLLLDAGANPNDSQVLYNRQFAPDNDHLELLLGYGLGRGETYPWRERLGELLDTPGELLRVQLRWAAEHNHLPRVKLLVEHGADFRSPYHPPPATVPWYPDDGHTAAEIAARYGQVAIVDYLVSRGADVPELSTADALVAAVFRADGATVDRIRVSHPETVERVRRRRPGLIVWAAATGRASAVRLLAGLGFDVNARGRGDVPVEGDWDTALHHAAARGDVATAQLLLSLGADPDLPDRRFGATPLGWARHFSQPATIALLTPLTRAPGGGGG